MGQSIAAGLVGAWLSIVAMSVGAADGEELYRFNIEAQPLADALAEFSEVTSLQLVYDSELATGRASPGVQGEYAATQALEKLLAETGLGFRYSDQRTVTLTRASASSTAAELGQITVKGWRSSETIGYRADIISSATKTEEPLAEVPVSVSVVTQDVIRDQNALSVGEALRNVAGVGQGPNPANVSVQEEVTIRGFESALVRVNGVQRRSTGPLSTANIDSIEVLKEPFSVLYGDLSPGGFVNIQTKRPQREASYELTTGVSKVTPGRGLEGRGTVDATGPLNADGSLLYRFIASAEGGSLFLDNADREQYFIAPSLSYIGLADRLRVDLDLSYLRNDETFLFGVPTLGNRPDSRIGRETELGSLNNDKETEDYTAELRGKLDFSDNTSIDAALTYHLNEHFSSALRPFGAPGQQVAADNTVRRSFSLRSFDTTDTQFETNLTHRLSAGEFDWQFLAGADVRRTEVDHAGPGFGNIVNFDRVNVLAPNNNVALPSPDDPAIARFARAEQTADAAGGYVQAEVWWRERLKLLSGVRYSHFDYTFEDTSGFRFEESPDSLDPRFGVLYKLTPLTSLYASYSTSFEQSFSFDPDNTDPLEAEQYEFGVKQEFFDGLALATLSFFQITQENLPTADPNDPTLTRQIGEAETRGVEVEFRGQLRQDLNLIASYAYLDNEITEDNTGIEGNRLPNVPKNEASLWLSYDAYVRGGETLTLGAGIFYEGARFTGTQNSVRMPGYATVDLNARYGFDLQDSRVTLQAGVKNLLDREYFVGGFGEGIAFRGQPRTVFANLSLQF